MVGSHREGNALKQDRGIWALGGLANAAPSLSPSALQDFLGLPASQRAPAGVAAFQIRRVPAGSHLCREGAAARSVFVVQAGHFKSVRTDEDGFEQVLHFEASGDVLGLDGLADGRCATSAVALTDAVVCAVPTADLDALQDSVPAFRGRLMALLSRQIAHLGEIAWLMAAVAADIRTARFLLHMSSRMAERGQSATRLHLPMCRRDIASHLGLAHESVSRSLTGLVETGLLQVNNRDVDILDLPALRRFARATRRAPNEAADAIGLRA